LLFPREAAEDAGFDVLRVISQPAAAALAYGKQLWISKQFNVMDPNSTNSMNNESLIMEIKRHTM